MDQKKIVLDALALAIATKLNDFNKQLQNIMQSRNEDTKSSAGDKYETGRAMAQIEMEKLQTQLQILQNHAKSFKKFDALKNCEEVANGAVFEASNGKFVMGIPFGKLMVGEALYHCISADSPFGKACMRKKVAESFSFMQQEITILWIQ